MIRNLKTELHLYKKENNQRGSQQHQNAELKIIRIRRLRLVKSYLKTPFLAKI